MSSLSIARDFTPFPGGRYKKNGKGSGQQFRDEMLVPRLEKGEHITIDLDGTSGYPSSFLEEAFGGLVRLGFSPAQLRQQITIRSGPEFAAYGNLIWHFVETSVQHA